MSSNHTNMHVFELRKPSCLVWGTTVRHAAQEDPKHVSPNTNHNITVH